MPCWTGLKPAAFGEAYLDCLLHLSTSPDKQFWLSDKAFRPGHDVGTTPWSHSGLIKGIGIYWLFLA